MLSPANTRKAELDYYPRPAFIPFHQRSTRWACIVAHRRAGKTVACVNELIIRALYSNKKHARYAYIAPFYSQAKNIAWLYLKDGAQPFIQSQRDVRESDLSVKLTNGATIRLYGADNPDALRGIYLDGVILDEYGDCRPMLWGEVIRPTLSDRKGWATFIGTPKGKNHFHQIYERSNQEPGWYGLTLKASESKILPGEELEELKRQMVPSQYAQEMECDFTAAIQGTIFADLIRQMEHNNQITAVPHDPKLPVQVSADLGRRDATALWFWQSPPDGGIHFIDYEEHRGSSIQHYITLLKGKPYNIERVWLPHDAKHAHISSERTTEDQVRQHFRTDKVPNIRKQQGIDAARLVLQTCKMDKTRCYAGIEALRAYKYKYNDLLKQYSNEPLHDWSSDGSDSFRYAALVARDKQSNVIPFRARSLQLPGEQPKLPFTLDELWEQNKRPQGFAFERARI